MSVLPKRSNPRSKQGRMEVMKEKITCDVYRCDSPLSGRQIKHNQIKCNFHNQEKSYR